MLSTSSRIRVLLMVAALTFFTIPALAAAEGHFERTLQISGAANVQLETGSGSIDVHSGSSNEVRIAGHIKISEWFGGDAEEKVKRLESNPPIQQSGNDVRIGHIDDPELKRNVSISYEVVVPQETRLHASSGSGSESVFGISGPVEATTGSGSLKISDIGSGVRAHTGSGSIQIDGRKAAFTRAPAADPFTPAASLEVLTAKPEVAILPSNKPLPDRCGQKPDRADLTFATSKGRCRHRREAGTSKPKGRPPGDGWCTPVRAACSSSCPRTHPSISKRIPGRDPLICLIL